jgi:RNA polymerase sigma factor (sigma-70 family)
MYGNFDDMTKKLSPTLRRIVHRMNCHSTFVSDDDLYQEAMVHMWVLFCNGMLDDKTDSYILQGCYFHLKNYLRTTLDKTKLTSLNALIDSQDTTLEETLASKEGKERDDLDAALLEDSIALKGLSKREKIILRLSMDGLTTREIGEKLGISHVMVVKIKAHIKEKCRALRR